MPRKATCKEATPLAPGEEPPKWGCCPRDKPPSANAAPPPNNRSRSVDHDEPDPTADPDHIANPTVSLAPGPTASQVVPTLPPSGTDLEVSAAHGQGPVNLRSSSRTRFLASPAQPPSAPAQPRSSRSPAKRKKPTAAEMMPPPPLPAHKASWSQPQGRRGARSAPPCSAALPRSLVQLLH